MNAEHSRFRPASPQSAQAPGEPVRKPTQLPRFFRWFTEHCVLRQIDASDVARIWTAVLHPAYEKCWTVAIPKSAAEVAAMVNGANADWQRGTRYTIAVLRKQTQEFVGWVEARSAGEPDAWLLDWFIHPRFLTDSLAQEALAGAADLMFRAVRARTLYANCPARQGHFEKLLNDAGFIELVPAGSLDVNGRPRQQALYELGQRDWARMHGEDALAAPTTRTRLELSLV
jgi:RimJ/RimL family protein N-acetyltransferase